ncbi:adenosylhomocysteinase [Amnibacterium setariae]|uniref:Adenosylhomocysteinase n=1 Tax=Amnibacterium setariae TaxID=2306585 RepID=A0A3A1U8R6_9MICO|nr:adenosylhomocysteinase [Amnibacterium setariae]RIX30639.1 adenosylhomocysteinase [Amnibacterium setariae]
MAGRRIEESPLAPLVAFSAATNLGLAGRAFALDGAGDEVDAVRRLLVGFGAREEAGAALRIADGRVVAGLPEHPLDSAAARLDRARARMPATAAAVAALGDRLAGVRIGVSLVLEPKTAVLALLLAEAGAEVALFAFAAETDDAVAAELRARGVAVHASAGATPAEERRHALALLDGRPQLLVDDGAHVVRLAHAERPDVVAGLLGAAEETTSGVGPLRAMAADGALRVPVIAANDAVTKTFFDNRHGTGETCVLAIARTLDDDLSASRAVVVGFGPVGEGVAERLRVLGARVVVVEVDPRRELAARFAGYATAPLLDAVTDADLVVSATGAARTVDERVLAACAEDAVVAVAGGAPEEVLPPARAVRERIAPHVERLRLPGGRSVRLLAGGDCVNIVAGEGNPIDVMDLSFAVQAAALGALLEGGLAPGVHVLPDAADRRAAALALGRGAGAAHGVAAVDWRRTRFDL